MVMKKFDLEILMNLHVLSSPECEKAVFGVPSICMCMCMCVRICRSVCVCLTSASTILFIFGIQEFTSTYPKSVSGE
jgi:hypothetical protein